MKFFFISLLLVVFSVGLQAQNILSSKDLSSFKVDALTETEIAQIQAQLQQAGMTLDQVEQQAIAKGMSPAEFAKLKVKLGSTKAAKPNANSPLRKMTGKKGQNSYTDSTGTERKERSENHLD